MDYVATLVKDPLVSGLAELESWMAKATAVIEAGSGKPPVDSKAVSAKLANLRKSESLAKSILHTVAKAQ
jgi:hypothetical protein